MAFANSGENAPLGAIALIEAAELIERRQAERTCIDLILHRSVVAGVLGVATARDRIETPITEKAGAEFIGVVGAETVQNGAVPAGRRSLAIGRMASPA